MSITKKLQIIKKIKNKSKISRKYYKNKSTKKKIRKYKRYNTVKNKILRGGGEIK